jgi:hypothetical protein
VLGVLGSDELEVTAEGSSLRLTGGERALEYRAD